MIKFGMKKILIFMKIISQNNIIVINIGFKFCLIIFYLDFLGWLLDMFSWNSLKIIKFGIKMILFLWNKVAIKYCLKYRLQILFYL